MAKEIPGTHLVGDFGQKALIVKEGKVLMCRNVGDPRWDFPGGRLHINEKPEEGLKREIREELGVEIEVEEPFHVVVWHDAPKMPRVLVVYYVTLPEPDVPFTLPDDEIEEVRWIGKDDIEKLTIEQTWKPVLYKFFAVQPFARKPRKKVQE